MFPIDPYRVEPDGVRVFTIGQINIFGEPHEWGEVDYIVVSFEEDERPLGSDPQFEKDRFGSVRPIHSKW